MNLNIINNYLTKNRCYQAGTTCEKIGIQIHTIGTGQGTAQSVADYWNQPGVSACVHYCVDADTEGKVLQFLPEERRSWADAGYGNNNCITIELCESDHIKYTGGASYIVLDLPRFRADILRGYQTAVQLCAEICKQYGWDPTAKLPNGLCVISSHDEGRRAGVSSGHIDPTHVWDRFGLSMDGFRQDVKEAMVTREKNADGTYTIKQGDTLSAIAKDFDVTVAKLKKWNKLDSDTILPGQILKFWYWEGYAVKKAPVRAGAGKTKKKLGSLAKFAPAQIAGSQINSLGKKWYKIWYCGKVGYVYSEKIKKS